MKPAVLSTSVRRPRWYARSVTLPLWLFLFLLAAGIFEWLYGGILR